MSDKSTCKSPIKILQPRLEKMEPIISPSSPETFINRIINENAYSTPQRTLFKKRLKKRSQIIIEEKIKQKLSTRYFDKEAELGSDNEEHDDIVKEVEDSEEDNEYNEEDNSKVNIENLINDDIKEDALQKDKYIQDEFKLDKERIRKVIDGPNDKQLKKKRKRDIEDIEDPNELPLQLRIEKMNDKNEEREEDIDYQSLLFNYQKFKNEISENEDNEDLKELFHEYQANAMKKINRFSNQHNIDLKKRIKENNEILENVILINKKQKNSSAVNQKPEAVPMKSFKSYLNKTNSFLQAFKTLKEEKEKELKSPTLRESFIEKGNATGIFSHNFHIDVNSFNNPKGCLYSLFMKR